MYNKLINVRKEIEQQEQQKINNQQFSTHFIKYSNRILELFEHLEACETDTRGRPSILKSATGSSEIIL